MSYAYSLIAIGTEYQSDDTPLKYLLLFIYFIMKSYIKYNIKET